MISGEKRLFGVKLSTVLIFFIVGFCLVFVRSFLSKLSNDTGLRQMIMGKKPKGAIVVGDVEYTGWNEYDYED